MSVHYKFKSALEYDTVTFDGLHISVRDLKNSIMQQKRIGKNTDFDLQVTNAQTKEIYDNEDTLIPKNTSLLIARIPSIQVKPKTWEGYGGNSSPIPKTDDGGPASKAVDLSSLDASEEDKIKAMISQSTQDYDPSNYLKIRGANQMGPVPTSYRCYKCHQGGHWIRDCPLSQGTETLEIKKSTGIPRSFMVPVEGPQVPGAMMTPNGSFAVPALDHQAYTEKPQPAPPEEKKPEIPEDLLCSLCSDLLTDAVMIPCCGDSYCDECIRSCLLESEDHECPACHERDISPGTLIPNRYLRNSVTNFKSTTGYVKNKLPQTPIKSYSDVPEPPMDVNVSVAVVKETTPPPVAKVIGEEKTVIREADSTETPKINADTKKPAATEDNKVKDTDKKSSVAGAEGPPGVSPSPDKSPKSQIMTNVTVSRGHRPHPKNTNERSPRRAHHVKRSPTYMQDSISRGEDRPGTPTVDEPGIGGPTTISSNTVYHPAAPLYGTGPPTMMGMQAPNMQRPPPIMPGAYPGQPIGTPYPPPGGPPPNFRLPPPGAPPYMGASGYNAPPRPVFDCPRPPLQGHSSYPVYTSGARTSRNRDYSRDVSRRGRTPTRIIDDPLEAFNRMLREKDERVRKAKQRKTRSYSRSSSRSFSPSPPRRLRSRSPRRRSRSRSRSFSLSRYRFKDAPISDRDRGRDRDMDRERDRDRDRDTNYSRDRERDFRDHREYGYGGYDRDRQRGRQQWNQPLQRKDYPTPDNYYHPQEMAAQPPPFVQSNRYPPRDVFPPHHIPPLQHLPSQHLPPPIRRYEDVAPPGTEQPPIPGLENTPRLDERYPYDQHNRDIPSPTHSVKEKDSERRDHKDETNEKERKYDAPSPDRNRYASPKRSSKEKDHRDRAVSAEKHRHRRRDDSFDIEKREFERVQERKRDLSDDERTRKNKDKKKKKEKREKKEEERKKRKEKKEKREHDKQKRAAEGKEKSERSSKSDQRRGETENKSHADDYDKDTDVEKNSENTQKHDENVEKHLSEDVSDEKDFVDEIRERNKKAAAESKREKNVEEKDRESEAASPKIEDNHDLYGDLLSEGIDSNVIENYGKLKKDDEMSETADKTTPKTDDGRDEGELSYDDDSEKDILELHTNEADLKTDLEIKNEMLAHLPERSKWEVDEELFSLASSGYGRGDSKLDRLDKSGKVTNEVLKRAENAIFAKAINAIRPIEIKKISLDRAKLYSGERDRDKKSDDSGVRNYHVIITDTGIYEDDVVPVEHVDMPKPRLSVKERLGCKVDDLDRIVKVEKTYDRNRSRSLSPLSRRAGEMNRNLGQGERRIEIDDRRRYESMRGDKGRDRHHRSFRGGDREPRSTIRRDVKRDVNRERDYRKHDRRNDRKEPARSRSRGRVAEKSRDLAEKRSRDRRKVSRSRSHSSDKDKRKKKDRKDKKKEKTKRHRKEDEEKESAKGSKTEEEKVTKAKSTTDKRKPTLDESNFEPDYDLETESEKDDGVKKEEKVKKRSGSRSVEEEVTKKKPKVEESSSSYTSDSSSDEERRKKKHRKHKKKRSRKDSSSSSETESSDSSDDDKDKRKKKHKKKLKKKKKTKHKN